MILASMADVHMRGKDLDACERQLRSALNAAAERRVTALFIPGDFFDTLNIAAAGRTVGDIVAVAKNAISSRGVHVYIIPGQHDKENETSGDALTVLEGIENITIIRRPIRVYIAAGPDFVAVDCVPWMYRESAFDTIKVLHALASQKTDHRILCAHLQMKGARMNGGHVCSRGSFSLSTTQLLSLGYNHHWLGDFHERQDVTGGRGGYVGALRQLSYAYVGQPQGFELYNTDTYLSEWIEINEAPRHEILLWEKDAPRPTPTPGYNTRIKTVGWVATALDRIDEAEIHYTVQTQKKHSRLDFDPTDAVLESPPALLDLYIDQKNIVVTDRAALHELLSELL